MDGEKIVPAAWKPGAVISLVSRWPREFLGGFASPWGNFHYRTGGIPQKPPIPWLFQGGWMFTKMDPSAKVFQCFFGWLGPIRTKDASFFFSIMGALLVDSDVVIDRYCNSFRYWDCSMLNETFWHNMFICMFYHYTINAYIEPHWIMYQSIYIHLESGVFAIKLRYSFIQTGILSKIWTWVRWPCDLPSLKLT